jgi:hypothetical protein
VAFQLRYRGVKRFSGGLKMETQSHASNVEPREDEFTKHIERYTGAIPSSGYLAVAVAAMAASLMFQMAGRGKWGNFIAQWVPTWLIIGLYNKLVKLEGHDYADRAGGGSFH